MPFEGAQKKFMSVGEHAEFLSAPVKLSFPVLARPDRKGTVIGKPQFSIKVTDEATKKAINSLMDAMVQDALKTPRLFDVGPGRTVGYGVPPWSDKK